MVKLCEWCGKIYPAVKKEQKYCRHCRGKKVYYVHKPKILKTCEFCSAPYESSQPYARFCSDACRTSFHYVYTNTEKICPECGKRFETPTKKRTYCTEKCAYSAKRKRDAARNKARQASAEAVPHNTGRSE